MLNGLDLFSGIGGLAVALREWVRPIAYCENDKYAQSVLLSRMRSGHLPLGPIWDDVRSLSKQEILGARVDVITGGFPCQDISVAGNGVGLGGERSGLFFEIARLTRELRPSYVFLENVPAITVRGMERVLMEFTEMGYDCRWTIVSAEEVGASHLRERWFLLAADTDRSRVRDEQQRMPRRRTHGVCDKGEAEPVDNGAQGYVAHPQSGGLAMRRRSQREERHSIRSGMSTEGDVADTDIERLEDSPDKSLEAWTEGATLLGARTAVPREPGRSKTGWEPEPDVGRVAHGVPARVDRIRGLGNAVVPRQAREAFERLMGLK